MSVSKKHLIDLIGLISVIIATLSLGVSVLGWMTDISLAMRTPHFSEGVLWGARTAFRVVVPLRIAPVDNPILRPNAHRREAEDDARDSSDDQPPVCNSANPTFPCVYTVRQGDSLASISIRWYGSEGYADLICSANSSFLQERYEYDLTTAWQEVFRSSCRYIDVGWKLVLPSLSAAAGD
jgi:hypothetical protein